MPLLSSDDAAILARLKKEGVTGLYHFTCVENLPYICRVQELYSKEKLETTGGWPPPIPGGNDLSHNLDRACGNWDKISLSFTPFTPMAFHKKRKGHLCFFVIKPVVATWQGVVFTDSNAAATGQKRGEGLIGLNYVNFDAIRSLPQPWNREGWVNPVQAEALIPDSIPFAYIAEIAFVSQASLNHAERLCSSLLYPLFTVKQQPFGDSFRVSPVIGFPYVENFIVRDTDIDQNVVQLSRSKNEFSKSQHEYVVVIVSLKALSGVKAALLITPLNKPWLAKRELWSSEFARQEYYRYQHRISLNLLTVGTYVLEFYLNGVCWASASFEIFE